MVVIAAVKQFGSLKELTTNLLAQPEQLDNL